MNIKINYFCILITTKILFKNMPIMEYLFIFISLTNIFTYIYIYISEKLFLLYFS